MDNAPSYGERGSWSDETSRARSQMERSGVIIPSVWAVYARKVSDGFLQVIVALEPEIGWHLSISHASGPRLTRYPTWDEIADARYRFVPNDVTMAMLLPPREQYVNLMETCFHLHQIPTEE